MNQILIKNVLIFALFGQSFICQADQTETFPGLNDFKQEMVTEHQFDRDALDKLFAQIEVKNNILEAIAKPAEKVLVWYQYRKIFLKTSRIDQGVDFMREHADTLTRAEAEYGVPAEIITAILGVETRFGHYKGKHRILDALATLGFLYPKRSKFFKSELKEFLLLAREEGFDPLSLKGSYAGAMGFPQFISSSYRHYAVDFDGDGKRNLLGSIDDAIGSIANYFKMHGWKTGLPVIVKGETVNQPDEKIFTKGLKPDIAAGELKSVFPNLEFFMVADKDLVKPLAFKLEQGYALWAGLQNFYVITRYNHSQLYAMAVFQLSQEIKKGVKGLQQ